MSCHVDLYTVKKSDISKIKDMTSKKFKDTYKDVSPDFDEPYRRDIITEILKGKEIAGLGEVLWKNKDIQTHSKQLFKNKKLHDEYNEEDQLFILKKEGLKFIIDEFRKKVAECYEKDLKTLTKLIDDKKYTPDVDKLQRSIKHKMEDWSKPGYGQVLIEGESLTSSWMFEYAIYDLVRLYKDIDWSNYEIIYTEG